MKLYCRILGSGPPLIILHGLYGSSDNWMSIAKMVGDHYKVYLPDLRNHGQSPHSDTMDYKVMSEDILELADRHNLGKFFMAGHSMGGKAAMTFAVTWPERISGMLIADISPFANIPERKVEYLQHKTILRSMFDLNLSEIGTRAKADSTLKERITSEKTRGFILKNLQRSSGNRFAWKLNVPALLNNLDRIMEGVSLQDIPEGQISGFPVIFLKGMESDYIDKNEYQQIRKIFPAAEIVEISEAGHWLHADKPEEVAKNLLRLSGND